MEFRLPKHERIFLYLTVVVLVGGIGAIVLSVAAAGVTLPTQEQRIDPTRVAETPPFDRPGVFEISPGRYQAVVVAQATNADGTPAWAFNPAVIQVPAGSEVEFVMTSKDVIHGFLLWDTNVNGMLIPGQVTRVKHTFDEAREYTFVCHEYCGIGHHAMWGKVVVG